MPLTIVTGPTYARYDGGLSSDLLVSSFEDRVNAKIQELESRGARIDKIEYQPSADCSMHTAYLTYNGHLSTSAEMISIDVMAQALDVSRSTIQDRCRRGIIKHTKAGPRYLIPKSELTRIASLPSF